MANYTSKLMKQKEIAEGTMAFYFERPTNFEYKAGNSLDLTIVDPPETDTKGNTRPFSIASAPYEKELMIATRMRDTAFKRVIKNTELNLKLQIEGPFGSFTLHNDDSRPAVFLMGGIGITPARSILLDAAKRKLTHKLYLFYSNRRPEDSAFLSELQELEKENPNYRFIGTMTDMEKSKLPWGGNRGYIDEALIRKHLADVTNPIYYLAGPPAMVVAMRGILTKLGVNEDNIRTEEFSGY
ncbi:MAG: FAD-dependent oxidoreductase [bacterium]|nr:FAD-dependent oxidoreductase [bacterium]